MIRFAICDDDPFMTRQLTGRLAQYMKGRPGAAYSVSSFPTGRALLESGGDFDLLFLDIQMEQPDGIQTARLLRQRENHCLLIFVTVLREPVFEAFSVEAYDYLVKPVEAGQFKRTMDRALAALARRGGRRLLIRRGGGCEVLALADLVYCEVQGRKLYLHQRGGGVVDYYQRLSTLEGQLDGRFFRCHRSYLVNLAYIRGCSAGRVLLSSGEEIPVSRLREGALTQALLQHMKGEGG